MRQWSKKRQQRWREVESWRNLFKASLGRCEACFKYKAPEHLDAHELVPGSSRQQALDQPYAVLIVCRGCHNILEMLTIPNQLAYLLRADPGRFDLEAYHKLIGRRWPDMEEIIKHWEQLP